MSIFKIKIRRFKGFCVLLVLAFCLCEANLLLGMKKDFVSEAIIVVPAEKDPELLANILKKCEEKSSARRIYVTLVSQLFQGLKNKDFGLIKAAVTGFEKIDKINSYDKPTVFDKLFQLTLEYYMPEELFNKLMKEVPGFRLRIEKNPAIYYSK